MENPHLQVANIDLLQRVLDRLQTPLHVSLEDEVERLNAALLSSLVDLLKGQGLDGLSNPGLRLKGALLSDIAGVLFALQHLKHITRLGHVLEADDHRGHGGRGSFEGLSLEIKHRAHSAIRSASQKHVAIFEGAILDEESGRWAAKTVQSRLNNRAPGGKLGVCL